MSCYISTKQNRFYVAIEDRYGQVAPIAEATRVPAVRLVARQELERIERRDKIGGRTFGGIPSGVRRRTSFELTTYLTEWRAGAPAPGYGPLFLGAFGGGSRSFAGGVVSSLSGTQLRTGSAHGLIPGQAVACGGEIRFVTAAVDAQTVQLNAPFTGPVGAGTPIERTMTFLPGGALPSVSIFDYWSPGSAVHRILAGAAVDRLRVNINADFHEFTFSGAAQDLLDSASFESGQGELDEFPEEPPLAPDSYGVVPGNLGQAWLGSSPEQFLTVTEAEVVLDNNLDVRAREFGSMGPRCIVAGERYVSASFSLYEKPDEATKSLYQAARQRSPISVMFQLGIQPGQLCGVYLKSVIPEVPEFMDDETRLEWRFRDCRAQGWIDDEIYLAFA
jgi:hypothetical protein